MDSLPATVSSELFTVAVNSVPLTAVVGRADPFQRTTAPEVKFDPITIKVNEALPALTEVCERLEITGADGGAAGAMVSVRVPVPVPLLLVALSATADVPAAAGVPEIDPVVLFTVSPEGSPVAP
jgi:hypothetical protein